MARKNYLKETPGYVSKNSIVKKFKVDKYIPMPRFYSPFVQTLYNLGVGESIGDLSKKQAYKYRQHFYRPEFKPKKFRMRRDANYRYRIWRIE